MIIVHALPMIIVPSCTMLIVSACTMIIVFVDKFKVLDKLGGGIGLSWFLLSRNGIENGSKYGREVEL